MDEKCRTCEINDAEPPYGDCRECIDAARWDDGEHRSDSERDGTTFVGETVQAAVAIGCVVTAGFVARWLAC